MTPYAVGEGLISVEGYNLLRKLLLEKKVGMVMFEIVSSKAYLIPFEIREFDITFRNDFFQDSGMDDMTFMFYTLTNTGEFRIEFLPFYKTLGNTTNTQTEQLKTLTIGNKTYSVSNSANIANGNVLDSQTLLLLTTFNLTLYESIPSSNITWYYHLSNTKQNDPNIVVYNTDWTFDSSSKKTTRRVAEINKTSGLVTIKSEEH